ncbi:TDT family transporter [Geosporobacter ferrireducens]|uniref:C4-dicarboxylate ABC transporter n=1 Tax=Geosporobacter ferrireducens TaxID=1424294 RepID=A0A1D8GI85_9FIRM|nr:TDT family transporter [Geosporobacter ferrireducens]AOT70610.1 C4-dicarboxylate ABC transporter [Geosporobacter ferrireducens]
MIKKLPLPIAGLILALAATGNLLLSYGSIYRNIFGIMSGIVLLLLLTKIFIMPKAVKEGFENPVIASIIPTFSMGLILLSTYIKPYAASAAYGLWLLGLALHIILIVLFTMKYIVNFNVKKVFPSYFIVYVGIVCASVTAPAFNLAQLGQYIFWFGFVCYLVLLPIVLYRTFIVKEIPEPAMPTLAIYTAPASLCLAGYLNSFQSKSILMVGFLTVLSLSMFIFVIMNMPKLFKLKFYPSYSAFTFPFVITAIAMKGTRAYLTETGPGIPFAGYFINILELWAVIMVLYVLIRYILFMTSSPEAAKTTTAAKA